MTEPVESRSEHWRHVRAELRTRLQTRLRVALPFLWGVLGAFVALLIYNLLFPGPRPINTRDVDEHVAQAIASITPMPAYSVRVNQIIRPALVFIETHMPMTDTETSGSIPITPVAPITPTEDADTRWNSLGSGVIINDKGDILTSLHVVEHAEAIQVTFADGTQSTAEIVNTQPDIDIAVLRAAQLPKQIIPAVLGGGIQVGDEVYAVGNPLGLYGSLSGGVVSAMNRSFKPRGHEKRISGLIQFDAAVNPGNSGGPLLNRYGQVVGIVTALVNPTGQDVFIGIGFAVPIATAGGAAGMPNY